MKKTIIIAASAALLLTGCSKNEVVPVENGTAISFSGYSGRSMTKGTNFTEASDTIKKHGFEVHAFQGGSLVFADNFKSGVAQSVGTGTTYYWPSDIAENAMSFYAVAPMSAGYNKIDDTNKTINDFDASSGDEDLVFAKVLDVKNAADVTLTFSHALAKIVSVGLKTSATDGNTYKIHSIKFRGCTKGTFSYADSTWKSCSDTLNYEYVSTDPYEVPGTAEQQTIKVSNAVIPQELKVSVSYSVDNASGKEILATVTKTGTATVEAGKAYVVNMTIPADGLTPIIFNASVNGWDTSSEGTTITLTLK